MRKPEQCGLERTRITIRERPDAPRHADSRESATQLVMRQENTRCFVLIFILAVYADLCCVLAKTRQTFLPERLMIAKFRKKGWGRLAESKIQSLHQNSFSKVAHCFYRHNADQFKRVKTVLKANYISLI